MTKLIVASIVVAVMAAGGIATRSASQNGSNPLASLPTFLSTTQDSDQQSEVVANSKDQPETVKWMESLFGLTGQR
jgi:hypothetical protein